MLGDYGMSFYTKAYPLYNTFLSVSTIGLPTAVSKMVAERSVLGNDSGAKKVFKLALRLMATIGAASSALMFLGARFFADVLYRSPGTYYSIIALAAAPFIVALISAYRGYFQGIQKMAVSSASQIIDQLFRVGCGVGAAFLFLRIYGDVIYGAAGASFGATVGAFAALLFLVAAYFVDNRINRAANLGVANENAMDVYKKLLTIALPIAAGGLVTTVMSLINSITIPSGLIIAGFTAENADVLFAKLENKAQALLNVPFVLGTSLAASLVPSISASIARNERRMATAKTTLAIKCSMLVSLPAAIGLSTLAGPLINLLFKDADPVDAALLQWLAYVVIFTLGMTTLQGILQGAGYYYKPIKNMIIGAVIKFGLNVVLVRMGNINIYGAIISSTVASAVIFLLNFYDVKKHIGIGSLAASVVKILGCSVIMGMQAVFGYAFLAPKIGWRIAAIVVVGFCVVLYLGLVVITKAVTMEEIQEIRG